MKGQVRTVVVKTDRDRPDQIKTGQNRLEQVKNPQNIWNKTSFWNIVRLCFHLCDLVLNCSPLFYFLSSANEVSTGPTCQFLSVCLSVCLFVCLSVFPVFFSRRLIGSYTGFWQWFWQPTYPTRCSELGWAVPHSDFLAWLSSATLKNFISGVSSRILMP